jgi:preprotein translocase subunit SecG
MKDILLILNILVSIGLVILILMQGRGGGLGSAWGGGGGEQFQTRRGVEKLTLRLTTILIVVFLAISVINLFLR